MQQNLQNSSKRYIFLFAAGILIITIVLVNYFTHAGWFYWIGWSQSETSSANQATHGEGFAPCHDLEVIPVWQQKFPKYGSEGSFRLLNITKDDVLDIVFGFGTGNNSRKVKIDSIVATNEYKKLLKEQKFLT